MMVLANTSNSALVRARHFCTYEFLSLQNAAPWACLHVHAVVWRRASAGKPGGGEFGLPIIVTSLPRNAVEIAKLSDGALWRN
jgi:hypothetical protein